MKKIFLLLFTVFTVSNILSQEAEIKDPTEYIKKESIGGELDFNKVLENKDQTLFLIGDIAYSKKDAAIYMWGKKVRMLGISSSKKATKLWEEINKRELTSPEKKALINGYESEKS